MDRLNPPGIPTPWVNVIETEPCLQSGSNPHGEPAFKEKMSRPILVPLFDLVYSPFKLDLKKKKLHLDVPMVPKLTEA
jgi:hypothetical protein